jgi:hypothetical protein
VTARQGPTNTRFNNEQHRTVDADRDGRPNRSASGVADHRQLLTKKPAGVNRRALEEFIKGRTAACRSAGKAIWARALRATPRTRRRAFCALPPTRAPPRVAPSETV